MSSQVLARSQGKERWNALVSLCGALVWAVFATLAGLRRAPFGIIELLFLCAPRVIVPPYRGCSSPARSCGAKGTSPPPLTSAEDR